MIVGSGTVGKTKFINRYLDQIYSENYEPTVFDNEKIKCLYKDYEILLELWDTSGQDCYDQLRPLAYKNVDVFLLAFNVIDKLSFHLIHEKWIPEVSSYLNYSSKILLVGLKSDLRSELPSICVKEEAIRKTMAAIASISHQSVDYIECSSKHDVNVKEVIELALEYSLLDQDDIDRYKTKSRPLRVFWQASSKKSQKKSEKVSK